MHHSLLCHVTTYHCSTATPDLAQNTIHQRHMWKNMAQVCRAYCSTAEIAKFQHFTQNDSAGTCRLSQTTDVLSGCSMPSKCSTNLHRKMMQPLCDELMFLQVGWRRSGLAVWSASGCRLMCSLRQTARPNTFTPLSSASSSTFATDSHKQNALPMEVSDGLYCRDTQQETGHDI